jgi:hypothetical protein
MRISLYKIMLGASLVALKEINNQTCNLCEDPGWPPCGQCDTKCSDGVMDYTEEIGLYKKALKKANKRR